MQSFEDIRQHPFIQLVQIAIGKKSGLDGPFTEDQWNQIMSIARQQSMPGICFQGMMALPENQLPPKKSKIQLAYVSELIAKKNQILIDRAAEITKMMQSIGLRSCVLKGQGVAMLYPNPLLRCSGDIDLWVDGGCRKVLKRIRKRCKTGEVFYHHTAIRPFADNTVIEVHFRPTWMNRFSANRRLQRFFESCKDTQFSNFQEKLGFSKPTIAFDCVYSAIHIYRHILFEGIGLRQIMDYYFILMNSSREEREKAAAFMDSLGMHKFLGALMYVVSELFLLEEGHLLCAPDKQNGEFLLSEIMENGEFGHYDNKTTRRKGNNLFARARMRMSRLSTFSKIAPSEVFWAPIFKVWQYLWRLTIPGAFTKLKKESQTR